MVDDLDSSILHRYDLDLLCFPSVHSLLNKLGIYRHEKGTVHYNGSEARLTQKSVIKTTFISACAL